MHGDVCLGKFKVAITDSDYGDHSVEEKILSSIGADLTKFQCRTEDDVIEYCRDADGLLNQYAPITRRVIKNLQKVRVIVRYGVGVDNIDIEAATERGILVANVIYDITDIADHTVSLILSLVRKIPWANQKVKDDIWDWKSMQPISRLKGKTVGIIGFGRIGRKVAQRLKGFEVRIIAYDPYVPVEIFNKYGVKRVEFNYLIREADVITIHTPLTEETLSLIHI